MGSRRAFLRNSALTMFGVGTTPAWLARTALGTEATSNRKKILVAIFQRGACDGLNVVVPHAEERYYTLRPNLAIPKPGATGGALDLDGHFGLHPALASLKKLYDEGQLAIVDAVGSPDPTRSHFDAQDYMESGTPGRKGTAGGWLNRVLPLSQGDEPPVRAVAMGKRLPRALRGANAAIAVNDLRSFGVRGPAAGVFENMYSESLDTELRGTASDTFEAVRILKSIQRQPYRPANGAKYPAGRLGPRLEQIARLIKGDVGLEVAFADMGGWDHHTNEAPQLNNLLRHFSDSLAAFHLDLGDRIEDIVLVTMSEFGRTAKENGNRGTDHGHGNFMFVAGGGVRGGNIYGKWPGLEPEQLYEGRDLAVTTDFRDVLAELVTKHLDNQNTASIFPGYQPRRTLNLL
ncbi:MAG: DUF1501 domain-containing protein [bacterium]|nr:DUF1501 domain-containing protein [bacterium]